MSSDRTYRLALDLSDEERRELAAACERTGERFVDFVRRLALEGARGSRARTRLARNRLAPDTR